ncbi:hypothetical protein [Synoicihabitans lomoniglobus]|uniref:Uncharacterized protein n=1 Tax=Synoicihabitans lomoniglobus TaxID=2909285 RepID=A0AAF0A1H9_9BACT|nr:hypothetical protein [Opitutaceae bacterium LMO-M01]WED65032.1 hypothetical protein PXH66_22005 [Opitutaceae bacterium LMO-M01]
MKPKFELSILSVSVVSELPGTWSEDDCLKLLRHLEFDGAADLPPAERRDYAVMALQDKEDVAAAAALLGFAIGKKLNPGRTQNLAEEMTSDRMWEEYADLTLHEAIFNAQVLLHQAFPATPQPEINQIEITLRALNAAAHTYLDDLAAAPTTQLIPEPVVVRCIAAAMPPDAILHRLFEDQIAGAAFPEAENILWQTRGEVLPDGPDGKPLRKVSLYSPIRWTTPLEEEWSAECEPFIESLND